VTAVLRQVKVERREVGRHRQSPDKYTRDAAEEDGRENLGEGHGDVAPGMEHQLNKHGANLL